MKIDYRSPDFFHIIEVQRNAIAHANDTKDEAIIHECDIVQVELHEFYLDLLNNLLFIETDFATLVDPPTKVSEHKAEYFVEKMGVVFSFTQKVSFIFDIDAYKSIFQCLKNVKDLFPKIASRNDVLNVKASIQLAANIVANGTNVILYPKWFQIQSELRILFYLMIKNALESDSHSYNSNKTLFLDKIGKFYTSESYNDYADLRKTIYNVREEQIRQPYSSRALYESLRHTSEVLSSMYISEINTRWVKKNDSGHDKLSRNKSRQSEPKEREGRYCPYCQESPCECSDPFRE